MPELPEVETTRRGVKPHIEGRRVKQLIVRDARLRWPVPATLKRLITGDKIQSVERRAKYLLLRFQKGHVLIHLGMSGSLRVVDQKEPAGYHDHVDFVLDSGQCLRFRDPRRFGSVLWQPGEPLSHKLLQNLGPEPLSDDFDSDVLFNRSRKRKVPVKTFIMNNHIVVGVGNIYANEALFNAGIHPNREAGKISKARYQRLTREIKEVLAKAIEQGGTTLKDFVGSDGEPGYFQQTLSVYGRAGKPCVSCKKTLKEIRLGQRSTVYCGYCQR